MDSDSDNEGETFSCGCSDSVSVFMVAMSWSTVGFDINVSGFSPRSRSGSSKALDPHIEEGYIPKPTSILPGGGTVISPFARACSGKTPGMAAPRTAAKINSFCKAVLSKLGMVK
jgi:hypothetical protein